MTEMGAGMTEGEGKLLGWLIWDRIGLSVGELEGCQ